MRCRYFALHLHLYFNSNNAYIFIEDNSASLWWPPLSDQWHHRASVSFCIQVAQHLSDSSSAPPPHFWSLVPHTCGIRGHDLQTYLVATRKCETGLHPIIFSIRSVSGTASVLAKIATHPLLRPYYPAKFFDQSGTCHKLKPDSNETSCAVCLLGQCYCSHPLTFM